jgi:hypothetical protein
MVSNEGSYEMNFKWYQTKTILKMAAKTYGLVSQPVLDINITALYKPMPSN